MTDTGEDRAQLIRDAFKELDDRLSAIGSDRADGPRTALEVWVYSVGGCNRELEAHLATIEGRLVRLEARAETEDELLEAGVDAEVREPDAQAETDRTLATLDAAIAATVAGMGTSPDPFGWELSLESLQEARKQFAAAATERSPCDHKPAQGAGGVWECYVCGEALEELPEDSAPPMPAPVATVGVQCPKCVGLGTVAPAGQPEWNQPRVSCPTCLGAGGVHTHREYEAMARSENQHRRALDNACADMGDGQVDVDRYLAETENDQIAAAERQEADRSTTPGGRGDPHSSPG